MAATNQIIIHRWFVCFMNQISVAGVAQGEPSCSVEIREPTESVLTGQRTWLECHLQGQWQGLTCTLNGERNRIHSSVGRHKCQLDIMAKTVGTHLVHCTVFCVDGSTNNSTINMTVIGRRVHAHVYVHVPKTSHFNQLQAHQHPFLAPHQVCRLCKPPQQSQQPLPPTPQVRGHVNKRTVHGNILTYEHTRQRWNPTRQ